MKRENVGALEITLEPDSERLKLFVNITSKVEAQYTAEQIEKAILSIANVPNLDRSVVSEMAAELSKGKVIEHRRIAKGRAAEPGSDGKLLMLVKKFSEAGGSLADEKGALKLSGFHLFDNIQPQQRIARLYLPKAGQVGVDVFGSEIPASAGKAARITLDKSVALQPAKAEKTYQEVIAQVAGYASDDGGTLRICEELVIKDDLDLRYGSLNFVGTIEVRGSVAPMLEVRATKGIKISGEVREARLISAADIEVKSFVYGGEHGVIVAAGTFSADVAHDAFIQARNVVIKKEAMNCKIFAQSIVDMSKANLLGGRCCVGKGLDVRILGSSAESHTEVEFSLDLGVSAELAKLKIDIESHEKAINLLELHLGAVIRDKQQLRKLSSVHQQRLRPLLDKYHAVKSSRDQLNERINTLLAGVKLPEHTRINLRSLAYAGVVISSLDKQVSLTEQVKGPVSIKLQGEAAELAVVPLEEFSAEENDQGDKNDKKA